MTRLESVGLMDGGCLVKGDRVRLDRNRVNTLDGWVDYC